MVALRELPDRRVAHVAMVQPPEHVVEDALPHGAVGEDHLLDAQLGEEPGHDRESAGQHLRAVGLESERADAIDLADLQQLRAQLVETLDGDRALAPAVGRDEIGEGARCPGGAHGLLPVAAREFVLDGLDLDARRHLGRTQRALRDATVAEVLERVADAAHVEAF